MIYYYVITQDSRPIIARDAQQQNILPVYADQTTAEAHRRLHELDEARIGVATIPQISLAIRSANIVATAALIKLHGHAHDNHRKQQYL